MYRADHIGHLLKNTRKWCAHVAMWYHMSFAERALLFFALGVHYEASGAGENHMICPGGSMWHLDGSSRVIRVVW